MQNFINSIGYPRPNGYLDPRPQIMNNPGYGRDTFGPSWGGNPYTQGPAGFQLPGGPDNGPWGRRNGYDPRMPMYSGNPAMLRQPGFQFGGYGPRVPMRSLGFQQPY